jgi:hypothetical protein
MIRQRHSHIFDRDPGDWYLEPQWVSERLFAVEDFDRSAPLLDPCTGTGRIANAATYAGYAVITADIVDRAGGFLPRPPYRSLDGARDGDRGLISHGAVDSGGAAHP